MTGQLPKRARNLQKKMKSLLSTLGWYVLAALFEIAGCFAFWAWLRAGRTPLWTVAGVGSLVLFAACLTRVDSTYAGRAFAAYGGVYIVASLFGFGLWKARALTGGILQEQESACWAPP